MEAKKTVHTSRSMIMSDIDRRDFLKLAGLGGVAFAACLRGNQSRDRDFYFVQLSDTHWGFEGAAINPDAQGTLKKAVTAINNLEIEPDFIVFTGDLTHITENTK